MARKIPALPAAAAILFSCALLWPRAAPGAAPQSGVRIAATSEELLTVAFASLADGDGVILVAPGLNHYPALSKAPRKLRVVQLVPSKERLTEAHFDGWRKALLTPVDSPAFAAGTITGRIGNVDLAVVGIPQLTVPAARCVVVLDPAFFLPLYENEVRAGMVDLSMKLYRLLSEKGADGFPAVVLDPMANPSFPLQWAYVADLWDDVCRNPDAFREEIPAKWRLRKEAEFLAGFGAFEESARRLDDARPLFPRDGSVDYQLARQAFQDRETSEGIRFLNRAFRVDSRFIRGFAEFGSHLASRGRAADAEMVYRAGLVLRTDDPSLNGGLLELLVDRAESLSGRDPEEATKDLEAALALPVPDPMKQRGREILEKMKRAMPK